MTAPLIDRVPDGLRDGLADPALTRFVPSDAAPALYVPSPVVYATSEGVPIDPRLTRRRRVLTDAEAAALTGAGRHNARQRTELRAEVGEALLAALADGVVSP